MAMTHAHAASTHAVERYLLGELSAAERDAFEAHAFDCLVCTEDLKAAAIFLDTSRSLLREEPTPTDTRGAGGHPHRAGPIKELGFGEPRVDTMAPGGSRRRHQ
jgi:anti-sigma factor RsiW